MGAQIFLKTGPLPLISTNSTCPHLQPVSFPTSSWLPRGRRTPPLVKHIPRLMPTLRRAHNHAFFFLPFPSLWPPEQALLSLGQAGWFPSQHLAGNPQALRTGRKPSLVSLPLHCWLWMGVELILLPLETKRRKVPLLSPTTPSPTTFPTHPTHLRAFSFPPHQYLKIQFFHLLQTMKKALLCCTAFLDQANLPLVPALSHGSCHE